MMKLSWQKDNIYISGFTSKKGNTIQWPNMQKEKEEVGPPLVAIQKSLRRTGEINVWIVS